jgi:hypothetical protein
MKECGGLVFCSQTSAATRERGFPMIEEDLALTFCSMDLLFASSDPMTERIHQDNKQEKFNIR